jgi:hypothetical protein
MIAPTKTRHSVYTKTRQQSSDKSLPVKPGPGRWLGQNWKGTQSHNLLFLLNVTGSSLEDRTVWAPTAKPLKQNALNPKLSCSCQEQAGAGDASDPAAAAVDGCSPRLAGSGGDVVSDSRDVRLATASDFPRRPGDTRRPSQVSCGDNRCGADVGTPAYRRRLAGDGKQKAETNLGSKDNGGAGSSRLLRDDWDVCMNH